MILLNGVTQIIFNHQRSHQTIIPHLIIVTMKIATICTAASTLLGKRKKTEKMIQASQKKNTQNLKKSISDFR